MMTKALHKNKIFMICREEEGQYKKGLLFLFEDLNCELLGLCVDNLPAHIALVRNIQEKQRVTLEFPVIADLIKDVA
ncbi:hypothetical protein [Salipaludibacillus sp. CF4.18]|uniref:hypothetical protein n=1 Tax=Salipaludibacillus sp. CF4.18 TaxID=3373081 RepID=UPI003EE54101